MPHYDRLGNVNESTVGQNDSVLDDEDAMVDAAQALREAEVEAVRPNNAAAEHKRLDNMSIDELRALAAELDVPDRGKIIERQELIAAIQSRM